jgi:hypothetical protein
MNTIKNGVEVRGTVNTVDFERVMNHFTSSFTKTLTESLTESFLKVVESQFGIGIQSNVVEEVKVKPTVVKPTVVSKSTPKSKTKNGGFEKLKNPILKTELEKCKTVDYDSSKFITIKELGIKSIHEMDKKGKKFWSEYFSKGKVYMRKGMDTSKLSPKILFERTIVELLNGGKSEPKSSDSILPQ